MKKMIAIVLCGGLMLTSCGDTQLPDNSDDQSISYDNTTQHDVNASVLAATIRQQIEKSYDAYEDKANYERINLMGTGANILSYFEKEEDTSDDSAESASLMPEQERKQLYRLLMENCPELGNIDYLCIRTEWDWDNGGKYIVAVAVNYQGEIGLDSAAGKCAEMVYAFNLNGFMGNTTNVEKMHSNLGNMTGVALNAELIEEYLYSSTKGYVEKIRRCFNNAYKFLRDYEDLILEKKPDDTIRLANLCEKKIFHGSDFIDVPAIEYSEGMTDTELLQYYRYAIAQQMEQEGVNPSYAEWIIPHYYGGFCYCCYVKCDLGCSVDCGGVLEGIYPKREDYNSSIWTTDYVIECIGNN